MKLGTSISSLFFALGIILGCSKNTAPLIGGEVETLAISSSKTDQDLVKITDGCMNQLLRNTWSQLVGAAPKTSNATAKSGYLEAMNDVFTHILVGQIELTEGDTTLRIKDFDGIGDLQQMSPEQKNRAPQFDFITTNLSIRLNLTHGLPRLYFKTTNQDEYDKFGNKIQHSPERPVVVREISLWLPQEHGQSIHLVGQQASVNTVNTLSYADCLRTGASK